MIGPFVQGDILLRPLGPDDTLPLYRAVRESIESLSYWLPWCHPGYSKADAASWIAHCQNAWAARTEFPFGIFRSNGDFLGCAGLSRVDHVNNTANLGYWVGTNYRGRGVATIAARLAVQFGFDHLNLTRIEIVVLPQNLASQRVAEKLGAIHRSCRTWHIESSG